MESPVLVRSVLAMLTGLLTLNAQINNQPQTEEKSASHRAFRAAKLHRMAVASSLSPQIPTNATCLIDYGSPCYGPQEIRNAYGLTPLLKAGYTGFGQSIVIVVSF